MTYIVHEEIVGSKRIRIFPDDHPENPREECFYTSKLAIMGGLGDEDPDPEFDLSDCIWLPVYRYEHSGVAFNTTGFHCLWDSAQTGYIYERQDEPSIQGMTEDQVKDRLRAEVATFSQWANGEVYGYVVQDEDEEEIDSCWGFIGLDWAIQEAKEAAA